METIASRLYVNRIVIKQSAGGKERRRDINLSYLKVLEQKLSLCRRIFFRDFEKKKFTS